MDVQVMSTNPGLARPPVISTNSCSNPSSDTESAKDVEVVILRKSLDKNISNGQSEENG